MVRLTDYVTSGGCACKIGPHILNRVLKAVTPVTNEHVLADMTGADDAGVYQISDSFALVQTLDFFTPMVNDPGLFGKIAAANALSDVYAMGGTPLTALNIVCFNDQDDLNILGKIIEGGNDKLKEAKVVLSGGHSIKDESTKYGLSVTGIVDPNKMIQNNGVQVGDTLILTKKLGVGLALNAYRLNDARQEILDEVFKSMTTLNKYAFDVLNKYTLHALTDVTGFGLLVHLDKMLDEKASAFLDKESIPYFKDCPYYVDEFYLSGGAQHNRNAMKNKVCFDEENFILEEILYDPQTSGGLLASVASDDLENILNDFNQAGLACYVIGRIVEKNQFDIYVR